MADGTIKIKILNPIHSRIIKGRELLKPLLSFPSVYYKQSQFRKVKKVRDKCLIKKGGLIYTGWIPKIEGWCRRKKYELILEETEENRWAEGQVEPTGLSLLPKTGSFSSLRPDQSRQVRKALRERRGLLVAFMGTGKTIMALSLIKAFEGLNILFLVPSLSLLTKTAQDLKDFRFRNVCQLGDGQHDIRGQIVVSTMQTYRDLDLDGLIDRFDVVIADECHMMTNDLATLDKILSHISAPVRIGLTATPPKEAERKLVCEGLLGPVLDQVTFQEAKGLGIIVEPTIELVPVPYTIDIDNTANYKVVHKLCLLENKTRNRLIVKHAVECIDESRITMIFCSTNKLEHGYVLQGMMEEQGIETAYVNGKVKSHERETIIKKLEKGELLCVIANRAWREGVNIRNIGAVILAGGGKGEEEEGEDGLLQFIGRGMRSKEGKKDLLVKDFLDPYKYLAEHSIQRVSAYIRMGFKIRTN